MKTPDCYISISHGKCRIIVRGLSICMDKDTPREAMAAAAQHKLSVSEFAWDGDRGQWIAASTIGDAVKKPQLAGFGNH